MIGAETADASGLPIAGPRRPAAVAAHGRGPPV